MRPNISGPDVLYVFDRQIKSMKCVHNKHSQTRDSSQPLQCHIDSSFKRRSRLTFTVEFDLKD